IMHFDLSFNRKNLLLDGGLADQVADNTASNRLGEQGQILFGTGFGTVTDIITGPGGMFVLSLDGNLYRVSENPNGPMMAARLAEFFTPVPEPGAVGAMALTALLLMRRRVRSER
ncbi:MAG: PEP-CTERM sorting domain-containing protein, partial [Planctomycetota bacterium]|nr:PEP-CTERM sorting domain-containing protein [Planctomycetota bacterium]